LTISNAQSKERVSVGSDAAWKNDPHKKKNTEVTQQILSRKLKDERRKDHTRKKTPEE